jgi:DNA-binding transcriptional MerR regulator
MTAATDANGAEGGARRTHKSEAAFRTISEVSADLDVPQHVLRFWETRFPAIQPLKRGGGRRYYRPEDVALLKAIRTHLYDDGFTIKGVQKLLTEQGVDRFVAPPPEEKPLAAQKPRAEAEPHDPDLLPFDLPPAVSPRAQAAKGGLAARQQHAEIEMAIRSLESMKAALDAALEGCDGNS